MKDIHDELQRLGAAVLVVSFAPVGVVAEYERAAALPFAVVADPERKAYRSLGLGQTTWRAMLHPGVVTRYLRLIFRGWAPRKASAEEDVFQLGGDFVLDGERRIIYAFRSKEPTDRPSTKKLLEAVRTADEKRMTAGNQRKS